MGFFSFALGPWPLACPGVSNQPPIHYIKILRERGTKRRIFTAYTQRDIHSIYRPTEKELSESKSHVTEPKPNLGVSLDTV